MVKKSPVIAGDTGSIRKPGRSPGEGNGNRNGPLMTDTLGGLLPGKSHG